MNMHTSRSEACFVCSMNYLGKNSFEMQLTKENYWGITR